MVPPQAKIGACRRWSEGLPRQFRNDFTKGLISLTCDGSGDGQNIVVDGDRRAH
jgi:hypothetical protein